MVSPLSLQQCNVNEANAPQKIPVVIINGFLGSGKTTLLRSLLIQSFKRELAVSVVVNDMSELDVDGELIANTELVDKEKHNFESIHSCVLSSKKGIETLDEVLGRMLPNYRPDLLIIETSGSCHPMPLIQYFETQDHLRLTGVLALADSLMLAHDYEHGQSLIPKLQQNLQSGQRDMVNLLVEQIMFCSHLLLTKADRVEEVKLQGIANAIHPLNPFVSVLSVPWGQLSLDEILTMPNYDYHRVAQLVDELTPVIDQEADGDRPYDMATRVLNDDRPFHPQRLWDTCHNFLDQRIYRSKGFFWLPTRDKLSLLWNQAAGSINLEVVGSWRSGILEDPNNGLNELEIEALQQRLADEKGRFGDRHCNLTVIGEKTQVDTFTEALRLCFLTDEEIEHWKAGGTFTDPWPKDIAKL